MREQTSTPRQTTQSTSYKLKVGMSFCFTSVCLLLYNSRVNFDRSKLRVYFSSILVLGGRVEDPLHSLTNQRAATKHGELWSNLRVFNLVHAPDSILL